MTFWTCRLLSIALVVCTSCTATAEPSPATQPAPPASTQPTKYRELPFDPEVSHRRTGPAQAGREKVKDEKVTERPGPDNTGVRDQKNLKPSGKITAKSGDVIENLFITGGIRANDTENVVIRNCLIDGGGTTHQGVLCQRAMNLIIENCEIYNVKSDAILGDGYTARFNQISQSKGDGFKAGRDVVIEGNYVHSLGYKTEGAHADGVQIRGGSNIRIIGNYFDMPINNPDSKSNAGVLIQGFEGKSGKRSSQDILIEGNWFRGGNYIIHAFSEGGDPSTIRIVKNRFFQGEARYGLGRLEKGVVWQGNVFDNTGATANPQAK